MITAWDLVLWLSGYLAGIGSCAVLFALIYLCRRPSPRRFYFSAHVRPLPGSQLSTLHSPLRRRGAPGL